MKGYVVRVTPPDSRRALYLDWVRNHAPLSRAFVWETAHDAQYAALGHADASVYSLALAVQEAESRRAV